MSTLRLTTALARLVELHGSEAVLHALRDACHCAGDFTTAADDEASDAWTRAGDHIGDAALLAMEASKASSGLDLATALLVVADIEAV